MLGSEENDRYRTTVCTPRVLPTPCHPGRSSCGCVCGKGWPVTAQFPSAVMQTPRPLATARVFGRRGHPSTRANPGAPRATHASVPPQNLHTMRKREECGGKGVFLPGQLPPKRQLRRCSSMASPSFPEAARRAWLDHRDAACVGSAAATSSVAGVNPSPIAGLLAAAQLWAADGGCPRG